MGHSFGGCVALAAAAKRPAAVRSLTVIEPAMHALATSDPHVRRFVFGILMARLFWLSPARRAMRFMKLVGIPAEMTGQADREELKRLGKASPAGRSPPRRRCSASSARSSRRGFRCSS